jgi:hypothetical protein
MVTMGDPAAGFELKALRFAPVVDAEPARLLAIGKGRQDLRRPDVGATRGDEALDIVTPSSSARLADDRERRIPEVGQGDGVAGHVGLAD